MPASYYEKLFFTATIPAAGFVLLLLLFCVPAYISAVRSDNPEANKKGARQQTWKLFYYCLFMLYPSVSSVVVRYYNCKEVMSVYYLVADFSVVCYTPQYIDMAYINIAFVVIYPIGIPLFFLLSLYKYRKRLDETGTRATLGLLYDGYERDTWWFETLDMTHKLTLTCGVAFVPPEAQLKVAASIAVLYLICILWTKPYIRKSDDRLILLAQMELVLLMLAGDVSKQGEELPEPMNTITGLLLIGLIMSFIGYWFMTTFAVVMKKFRQR
jgi:hypothetical protein